MTTPTTTPIEHRYPLGAHCLVGDVARHAGDTGEVRGWPLIIGVQHVTLYLHRYGACVAYEPREIACEALRV